LLASGVLANDADPRGNPLKAVLGASPTHGTLTLNADGSFSYTPARNYKGSDSFTYRASDGTANSGIATVSIKVNKGYGTVKNGSLDTTAAANGTNDPNAGVLADDPDADYAVLVTSVAHGTLSFNADGSFLYTPAPDFSGTDSFSYQAYYGDVASEVIFVTITVNDETSNPEDCTGCFAALDAVMASRSNAFAAVIAARLSVPTNTPCPQYGVLLFTTVSRSLRSIHDAQADVALTATAERLVAGLRNEVSKRSARAATLPPSKWTKSASNQIAAASRRLNAVLSTTDYMVRARLLATAAGSLVTIDRLLYSGELAPASLANRRLVWTMTSAGRTSSFWFTFGEQSFAAENQDGTPVATGHYTFARSAWNAGLLTISFENDALGFTAGETYNVDLKFGTVRDRMKGNNIRLAQ
jgi:VCBS repeat-containing protein